MSDTDSVRTIAQELYSFLVRRFPVCCASDEFTFFPQVVDEEIDWSSWDDLSPDSVQDTVSVLRTFRERLAKLEDQLDGASDGLHALSSMLKWVAQTLEEQFTLVRFQATQPTFALTIATVGLVQALQSRHKQAWDDRLRTFPEFLEGAFKGLSEVPQLYRDMGIQMAGGIKRWLSTLRTDKSAEGCVEAVSRYADRLSGLRVKLDFHLAPDLLERVVKDHTGSLLTVSEALFELKEEAASTKGVLAQESRNLGCGEDWEACYESIPGDPLPKEGRKGLLETEIGRLRDHCAALGFMGGMPPAPDSLMIEPLPPSLASVRAADSYNAKPGHPFRGGVFYIFGGGSLGRQTGAVHPVYRMTAAHEAYPGHHLLDLSRWNNPDPSLRSLEYPLFYEGWACFGEDLMLGTGAFERPYDRLILMRRRYRHAVRGKVDLMLHSGAVSLEEAARDLLSAGFNEERARETVRKYALRPAYQMCYTVGRRRFQRLFDSHGKNDPPRFARTVLSTGEILFEDLEKALERTMGRGEEGKRGKGEEKT